VLLASALASLPATFEVIWLESHFRPAQKHDLAFGSLYLQVLLLTLVITIPLVHYFTGRGKAIELAEAAEAQAATTTSGTPAAAGSAGADADTGADADADSDSDSGSASDSAKSPRTIIARLIRPSWSSGESPNTAALTSACCVAQGSSSVCVSQASVAMRPTTNRKTAAI